MPVYGLGRLADGRPYFTMKLVQGRTLAELLAARAGPEQDRPRLLKGFEQVCQALAYAHAQGVTHRDLKPANVMVGAFGEVQVMDWGLAKVLSPAPADPAGRPPAVGGATPTRCGPGGDTRAGTVLGTPGYMAPEQARGEAETLDARCDVFGLGALLCHLLTDQPPFGGGDQEARLRQAARGDLADAFARLDGCGADAELVALARRCLAAAREDRPANAGVLAAQLTAHLESVEARLRRAEPERAQAEVKAAEGRKRLRVQLGLAGALLLVVGGGTGAWLWQRRGQEVDRAVEGAMSKAQLLLKQAQAAPLGDPGRFHLAAEAAREAEELARASGSSAAVRREAEELARSLKDEADAVARDRQLLAALLEAYGPLRSEGPRFQKDEKGLMAELAPPSADEQFREAFRAWGLDVDTTPTSAAAARLGARPAAVVVEVAAALDEWTSERRRQGRHHTEWERPAALAQALDDDPGSQRRELRAMLARGHLERERALGVLALALRPVPVPVDAGWGKDRSRLRQLAATTDVSTEPVLGLLTLVRALGVAGDEAGAPELLRAAVRARPQEVGLHHALGNLLAEQQRWRAAAESYAMVRGLRPELGVTLAQARVKAGEVREGLALFERLSAERKGDPEVYRRFGNSLMVDLHRNQEAEAAFRQALRLNPDFPQTHHDLGSSLNGQGRREEAEAAYRQAIRLRHDYPEAHYNLGVALVNQGRHKEAEAVFRQAIRLQHDFPGAHFHLGTLLLNQGRHKEAEPALRRAIRLGHDFPEAHCNLGHALREQGRFVEALQALRQGHQLRRKRPGWPYPSADRVRQCERLVELDRLLPKVLRREAEPSTAVEGLELAFLCQHPSKRLHAAAARLAADAFAADPTLANDLRHRHRYAAACSAALAAAGQGEDAKSLPDKVVPALRRQTLTWLRADLAAYARWAKGDPKQKAAVRQRLAHWQQDAGLASVRDQAALDRLPEAERAGWRRFWDDVEALQEEVSGGPATSKLRSGGAARE